MQITRVGQVYGMGDSSDTGQVIQRLLEVAESNGKEVHRLQANSTQNPNICTVHWAVVPKGKDIRYYDHPTDKGHSAATYGTGVYIGGLEGTTKRCRAYKELSALLDEVQS